MTKQNEPQEGDFRVVRTERLRGPRGIFYTVRTCEEFIGGRWEGFTSLSNPGTVR